MIDVMAAVRLCTAAVLVALMRYADPNRKVPRALELPASSTYI